jgi:four helix bundle protein
MQQPYERLKAWEHAHRLYVAVHKATKAWPRDERYELTSQVRRAAFSVPANIAEGAGKLGPKEFRKGLDIAHGSLYELSYALHAAREFGYLSQEDWRVIEPIRDETARVLWALLKAVSARCSKKKAGPVAAVATSAP